MTTEAIPVPTFITRDPAAIEAEMIAEFEAVSGRTLQPAQIERLLISVFAYHETLVRIAVQEAGKQNLLAFARFPMLDYLGELVGANRLPASAAVTSIEFALAAPQAVDVVIPAGTRVQTTDAVAVFATDAALTILAGQLTGDTGATAEQAGVVGDGYAIGTVSRILDPVPLVAAATNLSITSGGSEVEDDETYRSRIRQAPQQFSVAGSAGAYRYHALSVDSGIVDVAVTSSAAGIVRVAVLTDTGLPDAQLQTDVGLALSAETVRPLTDTVVVVAPVEVQYEIDATVRVLTSADSASVLAAVTAAAEAYAAERRAGLGRDLVPSQIVAALTVAGVYEITLAEPAFTEIEEDEWANCTLITITEGVAADG